MNHDQLAALLMLMADLRLQIAAQAAEIAALREQVADKAV
jgi:hypothetical protein